MFEYEFLLVLLSVLLHSVIIISLLISIKVRRNQRNSLLIFPLVAEGLSFPIIFVVLLSNYSPSLLFSFGVLLVYSIIAAYVCCLEIPGFFLISSFDEKVSKGLTELRTKLLPLKYDYINHINEFNDASSENYALSVDSNLFSLVGDFKKYCEEVENLNEKFWEILIAELTRSIAFYRERSKHPYPKLIEVLSLTGLSFLIAQFLHIFG